MCFEIDERRIKKLRIKIKVLESFKKLKNHDFRDNL